MEIKKVILSKDSLPIFPITAAESILVKDYNQQSTLDLILLRKVDLSTDELTIVGTQITHTNKIIPNDTIKPQQILLNSTGHVIATQDIKPLKVLVANLELVYDGTKEKNFLFTNSFKIDDDKLELNWGNGDT